MNAPSGRGSTGGWARFDDLRVGCASLFEQPSTVLVAESIDEVDGVLEGAAAAAESGQWVVGVLAYEAAAAFDPAFPRGRRDPLVPLAWFGVFDERRVVPPVEPPRVPARLQDLRREGGPDWFEAGVRSIRELIRAGTVYQVNLTDRYVGTLDDDPYTLYRAMATAQGGAHNAYVEFDGVAIVSASPELFVDVRDGVVTARPMKGTTPRRARPDDDEGAGSALRRSSKDRAENVMIVDLLRNDLSRLARAWGVTVPQLFELERYETVWQLTSTVRAEVDPTTTLRAVFAATFPCGSVTGAPKAAAMAAIDELESSPRGVYCGAIGVIAPLTAEQTSLTARFSVAIRTAVVDTSTGAVTFGVGGGITWGSDPRSEDAELEAKAQVLRTLRPAFRLLETLRLDPDGPCRLDSHLARLVASASYFGYVCDLDRIRRELAELGPVRASSRLRILLAGDGRVEIQVGELTDQPSPVRLAVTSCRVHSDNPFLAHKTTNRHVYEHARASRPDADDVILVNEHGHVTETSISSILYRLEGQWFTPPIDSGCLPGIGRASLLAAGAVTERVLHHDQLVSCDTLEVVSSLRGRRPAVLLDP